MSILRANGEYSPPCAGITLTTFTQFAQKGLVGSVLALYASTMHVATLKCYLHVCSYTTGPDRSIMEVIWKIFLLSVSALLKS